jgi:hypothetical protein
MQNLEIFSRIFFCETLNSKNFLGTRFPGSDTFSTPLPRHAFELLVHIYIPGNPSRLIWLVNETIPISNDAII